MPSPRPRRRRLGALAVVITLLTLASVVPAIAGAVTATIEGSPLRIFVYDGSNLQANLENAPTNVFYSPNDAIGDAGLFFRFHDAIPASGIGAGDVAGPQTQAGIAPDIAYTPFSQTGVTGTGSAASPYQVVSVYKVADVLEITQTVKYVNGETTFRVGYVVKNLTGSAVRFRASHAADLYLEGSDLGTGFLDAGPPRIVGGQSETTGRSGGIQEVTPWSHFQAAEYGQIWSIINSGTGFDDTVVDSEVDNGVGVEWNDYDTTGLPAGQTAAYRARLAVRGCRARHPAEHGHAAGGHVAPGRHLGDRSDGSAAREQDDPLDDHGPAPGVGDAHDKRRRSGELYVAGHQGGPGHVHRVRGPERQQHEGDQRAAGLGDGRLGAGRSAASA